jgi:MoaA/NifB/PqqE/SkfB family radical SAM enzyme
MSRLGLHRRLDPQHAIRVMARRLRSSLSRPATAIVHDHVRDLAKTINAGVALPSRTFFRAVDAARETFVAEDCSLDQKLLALKVINLLIVKHEYLRETITVTGRPVGFMLDPANSCQLGCPSCMNSFNREVAEATFNPWPKTIMKEEVFSTFIEDVGPSAFAGHFYNNHEPFLNKKTPAYVRRAADYRVETFISSNLSLPKLDAETIVASGLKELMCAIDGVTQDVYERYRKGGTLELVFHNVAEIVAAKKRLNSATPIMRWQMLTFAHNVHQVEAAIAKAKSLGFDTFNLATPYGVAQDDPTITSLTYSGPEEYKQIVFNQPQPHRWHNDLRALAPMIDARLNESASERYAEFADTSQETSATSGDHCDWLHLALISDATGRIVPCCLGDYKSWPGSFNFSDIRQNKGNLLNSETYRNARRLMANPDGYEGPAVRCQGCSDRPKPQVGLGAVVSYLTDYRSLVDCGWLTDWSRHASAPPH